MSETENLSPPMVAGLDRKVMRICNICGSEMRLVLQGKRPPRYKCQPCHTKAVREKYFLSRNKAYKKYSKTEKHRRNRKIKAVEICGVASLTSARSKQSEKTAHNAHQLWTMEGDKLVLSKKYTESQLAKMLGRSIRAIQRRKAKLRINLTSN